jgi:hypothetical protein
MLSNIYFMNIEHSHAPAAPETQAVLSAQAAPSTPKCWTEHQEAIREGSRNAYVPACTNDGLFEQVQCYKVSHWNSRLKQTYFLALCICIFFSFVTFL